MKAKWIIGSWYSRTQGTGCISIFKPILASQPNWRWLEAPKAWPVRAHHVGTGPVLMIVVVLILVPPIPTVQAVFPIRVCVHCEKRTRKTTFSFLFYCIGLANATHSKGVYIQVYAVRSNDLIFGHVNKNKEEKGMLIQYMQIGYPVLQVLQLLLNAHSYIRPSTHPQLVWCAISFN